MRIRIRNTEFKPRRSSSHPHQKARLRIQTSFESGKFACGSEYLKSQ